MRKKIIMFSRDPGGANTIIPLVPALKSKSYEVKLFGKDVALSRYKRFGLEAEDITRCLSNISVEELKHFLISEKPAFVITSTSGDDYTEKYMWKACEEIGIPSFAILDQWLNYGVRFSDLSVSELEGAAKKSQYPFLPSRILVMDTLAKDEMIAAGIERDKILVTGQPYFDLVNEQKKIIGKEQISEFKAKIDSSESDYVIVFASEVLSKTYNETDTSEHYWGYTERTICREVLNALVELKPLMKRETKVVIRLHPKEDLGCYDDIIEEYSRKGLSITVDKETNQWLLIQAADLICGMSSMFLIESVVMGKPTMSVQLGLRRENPFVLDRINILKSITEREALENNLKSIIIDNEYVKPNFEIETGAVEKVIEEMEEYLCQSLQ